MLFKPGIELELDTAPAVPETGEVDGVEGVYPRLPVSNVGEKVVVVPLEPPIIGVDAPPAAPPDELGMVKLLDGVIVGMLDVGEGVGVELAPPPMTGVEAPPAAPPADEVVNTPPPAAPPSDPPDELEPPPC